MDLIEEDFDFEWDHMMAIVSPPETYFTAKEERIALRKIMGSIFLERGFSVEGDVCAIKDLDEQSFDYPREYPDAMELIHDLITLLNAFFEYYEGDTI